MKPLLVERLEKTFLEEHFRIIGSKKYFEGTDEMQKGLDDYLVRYNTKRPHQGRNMKGMTPYAAFKKGLTTRPKGKAKAKENQAA
jgi:hypothetical protein